MANSNKTEKEMFNYVLGQRIQRFREELHLTREYVCGSLGINQNTLYNYESGRIQIPVDTLYKLAELLDCSVDFLVGKDSLTNAKFVKEILLYDEVIEHFQYKNETFEISNFKQRKHEVHPEKEKPAVYNFGANLNPFGKNYLYAIVLNKYNEVLRAPEGSIVLVRRLDPTDNIFDVFADEKFVVVDETIGLINNKTKQLEGREISTTYITKITPLKTVDAFATYKGRDIKNKWAYYSPYDNRECIVDSKYLKNKVIGIVVKVIIDY